MKRLVKLRKALSDQKLDGFLVTNPVNRRYLSGFTGSAGVLLITGREQKLFTDFRYIEQASAQAPLFEVIKHEKLTQTLAAWISNLGLKELGFESNHVTYKQFHEFAATFEGVNLVPAEDLVENLRVYKEADEIEHIRKAAEITDRAFRELLPRLKPGRTEVEVALELEFILKNLGSEGLAFDPIVASGPNSALPHVRPGDRVMGKGDFLVLDFGARYKGYCADMTRTVLFGPASEKHQEIYQLVLEAQLAGVKAVAAGKSGVEVDGASRSVISEAGYGGFFGHGLGHGVGLEVHEKPRLSPSSEDTLAKDMVVTVEPGIYLPGWGGVRIEDLVVVTETCDILTTTPKELVIIEN